MIERHKEENDLDDKEFDKKVEEGKMAHLDYVPFMLANRGDCTFVEKVRNIEEAGAGMAIIIDNKEEDINTVQDHLIKIKEENLRLENENKRLNFVITNYIRENELLKIDEVKEILNTKNIKENFKKSQKTSISKERNMKKFIEKWRKGLTTFEINEEIVNENLTVKKELKKKVKL